MTKLYLTSAQNVHTIRSAEFEWDPEKAAANLKKHFVDFADAIAVFFDLNAVTIADPDHEEERFVTIGMDSCGRVLVVVYTYRADGIRMISARKANRQEREKYEG